MKFDIIDALDKAQKALAPYDSQINCSKSEEGYLVQIKVIVPSNQHRGIHPEVYGQQFAFTNQEVMNNEWYVMNDKFDMAIASLKRQIEE